MMKKFLILLVTSPLITCGGWNPPIPPEPPWECPLDMPECGTVNQQCSSPESPCWHNPTQDPKHCEEAPKCPELPPNLPPDIPPIRPCPYPIPANAEIKLVAKPFGQGQDVTVKVCAGNEWCLKYTGKNQTCCPPAPEGSPYSIDCGAVLLKQACPSWIYLSDGTTQWKQCLSPPNPEMSCDHFDHDDPQTPNKYEGKNPQCLNDFNPVETGYWQVAHGWGYVKACTADGVCSNRVRVDK